MHVGTAELSGKSLPPEGPVRATARQFRFGAFEFRTSPARLSERGRPIKARPQALQVLELLLSRAGETVTREEIRSRLWGDAPYLDHDRGINSALLHLRKALGDDPQSPRFIETVPRHGYRFIASVEFSERPLVSLRADDDAPDGHPPRFWRRVALWSAALATVAFLSALWGRSSARTAASAPPRLMITEVQDTREGTEVRPSAVALTDDLVRILVRDHADQLHLAVPDPASADASPTSVDYLVMSSLTLDEHGDYAITLRLVRDSDRKIVWVDTRHLPAEDLPAWPALAATDIVQALESQPAD